MLFRRILNKAKNSVSRRSFVEGIFVAAIGLFVFYIFVINPLFGRASPTTVATNSAVVTGKNSAVLNATLTSDGSVDVASRGFEYGTTNSYGTKVNLARPTYFSQTGSLTLPSGSSGHYIKRVRTDASNNIYVFDKSIDKLYKFAANGTLDATFSTTAASAQSTDIFTVAGGYIYTAVLAGQNDNQIKKFDINGTLIATFGVPGSAAGQLTSTTDIVVDGSGYIFVSDANQSNGTRYHIQKFNPDGSFSGVKFAQSGTGTGQLQSADRIAFDTNGNILAVDNTLQKMKRFDTSGLELASFDTSFHMLSTVGTATNIIDLTVSPDNYIYATVGANNVESETVQKITPNGQFSTKINKEDGSTSQLLGIASAANDSSGNLYIGSTGKVSIFRYAAIPNTFELSIATLQCGTTYHYRSFVTNGVDGDSNQSTAYGSDLTFTTDACSSQKPGNVQTSGTVDTNQTKSTLLGAVNPYDAVGGTRGFEFGLSTSYGQTVLDSSDQGHAFSAKWNGQDDISAITTDKNGNVYVVFGNLFNQKVQVFSPLGSLVRQFPISTRTSTGVAVDSVGNIFVSDTQESRIVKYDVQGNLTATIGSPGNGPDQFSSLNKIAIDSADNLIAADTGHNRLLKFNAANQLVGSIGDTGSVNSALNAPRAFALDQNDNVYVLNAVNNTTNLSKYTANGAHVGNYLTIGSGADQVSAPSDIAVDNHGYVYVMDTENRRIQVYKPDIVDQTQVYTRTETIGRRGVPDGLLTITLGRLATDPDGNVYVSTGTPLIQKYSGSIQASISDLSCNTTYHYRAFATNQNGKTDSNDAVFTTAPCDQAVPIVTTQSADIINRSNVNFNGTVLSSGDGNIVSRGFEYGTSALYGNQVTDTSVTSYAYSGMLGYLGADTGQFNNPRDVATDSSGNLFVNDTVNRRIQKFDKFGVFVTQWDSTSIPGGVPWTSTGISVDRQGNIYIVDQDYTHPRVLKFTNQGAFISSWIIANISGNYGIADWRLTIDSQGTVYVTDTYSAKIHRFAANGTQLSDWGSYGTNTGQFKVPVGIAVDSSDNVYVVDVCNNRIQKFDVSGTVIWTTPINYQSACASDTNIHGYALAIDSRDILYVTSPEDNSIRLFSTAGSNQGTILSGVVQTPGSIAIDPFGSLYITTVADSSVRKYTPPPQAGAFSKEVTGLACGTTYHFRGFASNSFGTGYGTDQTATTTSCSAPPLVQTLPGSAQSVTSYSMAGSTISNQNTGILSRGFQYGLTSSFGKSYTETLPPAYSDAGGWGAAGTANGQFGNLPSSGNAMAASADKIYVADSGNNRIQVFSRDGTFQFSWGQSGNQNGQFNNPTAITVDPLGFVYVSDTDNNRVQKFTDAGVYVAQWSVSQPRAIDAHRLGYVYVAQPVDSRILQYSSIGNLNSWTTDSSPSGTLPTISDISVDTQGNVYVITQNTVKEFDVSGAYVNSWGSTGSGPGQFVNPYAIEVDDYSGLIYISDTGNQRIQTFNLQGDYIEAFSTGTTGPTSLVNLIPGVATMLNKNIRVYQPYQESIYFYKPIDGLRCETMYHYRAFATNTNGTGYGEERTFTTGSCAPVVTTDNVSGKTKTSATLGGTVIDKGAQGVTRRGFQFGTTTSYDQDSHEDLTQYALSGGWGQAGTGPGSLASAGDSKTAVDSEHNVYVSSYDKHAINKFDSNGNLLAVWTSNYNGDPFEEIGAIAVDSHDNVVVAESGSDANSSHNRIQKFDKDGNSIVWWASKGTDPGQYIAIDSMAIGPNDDVYTGQSGYQQNYQVFSSVGTYLRGWNAPFADGANWGPSALTVDSSGNVYATEFAINNSQTTRVMKYAATTNDASAFGPALIGRALGIAISDQGMIYIGTSENITKVDLSAAFITYVVNDGSSLLNQSLSVDSTGSLIAMTNNYGQVQIKLFSPLPNEGAFSANVTSLACGTLYHYRAYAINDVSTGFGSDATFTTNDCFSVTTLPATDVTQTFARFNGSVPDYQGSNVAVRGFEYGTSPSYGSIVNASNAIADDYSSTVPTTLTCGTTYHYRAYANNGSVTVNGADETFTTDACALQTDFQLTKTLTTTGEIKTGDPVNYHIEIKNIGSNAAQYQGTFLDVLPTEFNLNYDFANTLNSNNPYVGCVDYGMAQDTGFPYFVDQYSGHRIIACQINSDVATLAPSATVEFDIVGTAKIGGFIDGSSVNKSVYFTSTANEPAFNDEINNAFANNIDLFTIPSNNISIQTYQLPSNQPPTVQIIDPTPSQTFTFGSPVDLTATASDPDGTISGVEIFLDSLSVGTVSSGPYTITASGLPVGQHTVFAVATDDKNLTTTSNEVTFTIIGSSPVVTTELASGIVKTAASLNGTVVTAGSSSITSRGFQYGLTTSYGTLNTEASATTGSFSRVVGALSCGTTYHYRAFATNDTGTGYGNDRSFATIACDAVPSVTTNPATNVTTESASLRGSVTSTTTPKIYTRGFNYGLTNTYGATIVENSSVEGDYTIQTSSLTCGKTYHYRAFATNNAGIGYGGDRTFVSTPCAQPPTVTVTAPTNNQLFPVTTSRVSLTADARSSTSQIQRVAFTVDGASIGFATTPPYSLVALGLKSGIHSVYAQAFDTNGLSAKSETVYFVIQTAPIKPPTISPIIPGAGEGGPTVSSSGPKYAIEPLSRDSFSRQKQTYGILGVFVTPIGAKLFKAFPLSLIIFLLILAALYAAQSMHEYALKKKLMDTIHRYEITLSTANDFLSITSHYLNTPVAILSGAVELMIKNKEIPQMASNDLMARIRSFGADVQTLLTQQKINTSLDPAKSVGATKNRNPFKEKSVWIPALVVFVLLSTAGLLSLNISALNTSFARKLIEFGLFMLAFVLLALSNKSLQNSRAERKLKHQQLDAQAALYEQRRAFIESSRIMIDSHLQALTLAGSRLKKLSQSKLFFNGLAMIESLEKGLITIHNATDMKSVAALLAVSPQVEKQIAEYESRLLETGIFMSSSISPGITTRLKPEELHQLVGSVIDNAIKFSKREDTIHVSLKKSLGKIKLTVTDKGIGVSKEKQYELFQPFARATDSMKYNYEGAGLNLYIDKVILARIGGHIEMKSREGEGTAVVITMPSIDARDSLVAPAVIGPVNSSAIVK